MRWLKSFAGSGWTAAFQQSVLYRKRQLWGLGELVWRRGRGDYWRLYRLAERLLYVYTCRYAGTGLRGLLGVRNGRSRPEERESAIGSGAVGRFTSVSRFELQSKILKVPDDPVVELQTGAPALFPRNDFHLLGGDLGLEPIPSCTTD